VSDALWSLYQDDSKCIPTSNVGEGSAQVRLDRVCVNAISIPKTGGQTTSLPAKSWCAYATANSGTNNYDGTTMFVDFYSADVYVASWNIGMGMQRADAFKNGALLANPFPSAGEITAHPLFVTPSPDDTPTLIGRSRSGFWVSTGLPWTTSLITSGQHATEVTLSTGTQLRQIGFAAALGENFVGKHMFLFYTTIEVPRRIQGVKCAFFPTVTCATLPASITPAGSNAYSPAAVFVNHFPGGDLNVPWLSYWTDATSPAGNLQMIMSKVNLYDGSLTPYTITQVNETPCPNGDDWGDYDALTVGNNGGGFGQLPFLLRYLTDSTASACNTATGNPQHVSVTLGNPNQ
jgi:hypothetical protein